MTTLTMEQPISEERRIKEKAQRNLVRLGTFSIVMLFGGLTSAYVVRKDGGAWFSINMPMEFWISTAIILLSSVTMILAEWAYKANKKSLGTAMIGTTFLLGLLFTLFQFLGWAELKANGIYFSPADGQGALISGSFIIALSGLHLAHLLGGLIALLITLFKGFMGKYHSGNVHGVKLAGIYWHFLDGLWIYLFLFLTIFK
ncbi:MAG TPA: cytochrome c oxidase subunit 3 [Bacteroidia bacterium]|nr:cytochrome c oxidase subunit 3 [Bacteroidia bacterium]